MKKLEPMTVGTLTGVVEEFCAPMSAEPMPPMI
jgi:hypothetical protein